MSFGPYRILEKIGEGGMGEAYMADQLSPVRRRVALKLIKLGMDTKQVVARFESERQALALLNHPNIAHVFDAGISPEGRPYFAMEFVQGISMRAYCDTHRLPIPERLRLFSQVCEGVQHAHQKGIIHRDLKPSNILVSLQDGRPVPKIIDFGIAKATSQRLTESTLHTMVGNLIGTPAYMSPEQADPTLLDVDTRTDVYSLGAVLYELLTGELPLASGDPRAQRYEETLRLIREVEPMRPSIRVATGWAADNPRLFRADRPSMVRDLRGDLDWIVLKALEKDRTRRYDSASELAADIERHLNHEPVLASPPSTPYRLRKFIRRHRVGVAAGATVGLALIAGIVGTSVGLARAREAEQEALVEAETAKEVTDFMVGLFHVSDPSEARGNTITAREVLDEGAQTIVQRLSDKPAVRVRLMKAIGDVYGGLGLDLAAEPLRREILAMQERVHGPNSPEVAAALCDLGGRANLRRALLIRRSVLGPRHMDTAYSEWILGLRLIFPTNGDVGESTEVAGQHLERALAIYRSIPGKGDQGASWCLNELGNVRLMQHRYGDGLHYFREALVIKERVLGPEDFDVATGLSSVGNALMLLGRDAEARPLFERAVRIGEERRGPNDFHVCGIRYNLGECLRKMGRTAEARALLEQTLTISESREHGAESPEAPMAHFSLALLYAGLRQDSRAEPHFRRVVDQVEQMGMNLGTPSEIADWFEEYADLLDRSGRDQEAAKLHGRARYLRGEKL